MTLITAFGAEDHYFGYLGGPDRCHFGYLKGLLGGV